MDLDKAWLYRQGSWTEVDDPAAKFPEELDNLFEKLHLCLRGNAFLSGLIVVKQTPPVLRG